MAADFAKAFYASKAWRDLAFLCKVQAGGVCGVCGFTGALVAHHKIELTKDNISNPAIALSPCNIEVICMECHNKRHRRFGHNGHGVYMIWGSPLSGKNSYVREVMQHWDLVVDIDGLYAAVSGQELYSKPENLKQVVFRLRDVLYDMIYTRFGQWHDCYIIGGFPNEIERNQLADRFGAELIYIASTEEECLERAKQRPSVWAEYVRTWWASASLPPGD